jgi:hypothetical protein
LDASWFSPLGRFHCELSYLADQQGNLNEVKGFSAMSSYDNDDDDDDDDDRGQGSKNQLDPLAPV